MSTLTNHSNALIMALRLNHFERHHYFFYFKRMISSIQINIKFELVTIHQGNVFELRDVAWSQVTKERQEEQCGHHIRTMQIQFSSKYLYNYTNIYTQKGGFILVENVLAWYQAWIEPGIEKTLYFLKICATIHVDPKNVCFTTFCPRKPYFQILPLVPCNLAYRATYGNLNQEDIFFFCKTPLRRS